jgi:hypothetical protein
MVEKAMAAPRLAATLNRGKCFVELGCRLRKLAVPFSRTRARRAVLRLRYRHRDQTERLQSLGETK